MHQETDVVISGVGGYFPGARNMEELKQVLLANEIPLGSRWKEGERGVSNKMGVIDGPEFFDAAFFGIHRHQASFMDPMQRLILERTFEALVDAGVNPQDVRGKKIGVYTASSIGENDNLFYESIVSGFGVTGHSRAMMANRISYWLNLKGPSCAYDSNWNGGLEVLSMGVDAVRQGHCEAAIVGTANLNLHSEISWLYNDMGLLSPDGSNKAYDVDAKGYVRSDGVIVMYIQRACDAKRHYASVIHSEVLFNGARDGSFLDIDERGMTSFIENFYKKTDVDPADVEYVETYGSALKETDQAELNAIERVYCNNREGPLLVGSVKTQLGHAEASSTLTSLAKVLIAFETNTIPAHLQYEAPNPKIAGLTNGNLKVVTKNHEWKGQLAAVHGIGISSSYGHVLLRGNPKIKRRSEETEDDLPRLIVASTRNEAGIEKVIKTIQNLQTIDPEYVALTHELFSKTISGHLYRGYAILDKNEETKQEFEHYPMSKRPVWFVYSGMGSQWAGMANDLMRLPIFAESIMKCHEILLPKGVDLLKIVTENDPKLFDNILHSFVGIAAIQIGLTDVLKALGVVPDGIIGHSVGELGCSYADDCLTAEQMIMCAYSRGKASIEVELIKGMMAAIGLGYNQVKDQCPPTIEVACHNSSENCTISGPAADMEVFVKSLQDTGIFARLVNVANIAYHSKYIKPAAPNLLKYLKEVIPNPKARSSKWISTSVQEDKWNTDLAKFCSADYHTNNLLSSVLFEEGSKHIPKEAIVIEIAPHGLLQAILKKSLKTGCTNIPLTRKGTKNGLQFLFGAVGKMFLAGIDVNLATIYPRVDYPVSRSTASLAPLVQWEHGEKWRTGVEDKMNHQVTIKDTQVSLNNDEFSDCAGHVLDDSVVFPISAYLEIIVDILTASTGGKIKEVVFENLKFNNVLVVPKIGSVPLYAMIQKGSGDFEVLSGESIILSGNVRIPEPTDKTMVAVSELTINENSLQLTTKDIYGEFAHRGHKYHNDFKSLQSISITEKGSLTKIRYNDNWKMFLEGMFQQVLFEKGEKYQNVLIPTYILKIVLSLETLPEGPADIENTHNYYTNVSSNKHIQIVGIQTKPLAQSQKPISYQSLEFVPFNGATYDNIESVISNCVHFVLDNFEESGLNNIVITEIETKNPSLVDSIKTVLSKNLDINANLTTAQENNISVISLNNPVLIISNNEINATLANVITTSHAFALIRTNKDVVSYEGITQVARFEVAGVAYSLIRRLSKTTAAVVQVTGDALSIKDLARDNLQWVSNLKAQTSKSCRIFLVSSVVPLEGITNFVQFMKSSSIYKRVRSVFLMEKNVEFGTNAPIFQQIVGNDLSLCVFKHGHLGTYLPISVDFKEGIQNENLTVSTLIAKKNLHFIGINPDDESLLKEKHEVGLGNIDYVGVNTADKKIMGLARVDSDSYDLIPDPILVWNIPQEWSMEDGCTIPHAYTTAYYCLILKARLKHGETVLIHNGSSGIGIASISIALSYGCTIFTTVATDEQKIFLKKMFYKLRDRNILNSQNSSFEPHLLMATGGEGAHVIINTLTKSLLNASVRCTAEFGRFIQLGKYDVNENNSIGMSLFLKNTSFSSVIPEEIFDRTVEEKQKLRDLVEDGLQKFIVRPIVRTTIQDQDIKISLENLTKYENIGRIIMKVTPNLSINYLNVSRPNQFICDAKCSYLIYGGTAEIWTDMVEWLVLRGARKIVVCSDFKPQQNHINRRLSLLQTYFKADINYVSNKMQTRDGASELLSEVYSTGPIHGVFLLPVKEAALKNSDLKSLQYLDKALRTTAPKVHLINFITDASGVVQLRSDAGFPTYNVVWDHLEFSAALDGLDKILSMKVKCVIIKSEKLDDDLQETTQALYKKLTLMLPASSEELLLQNRSAPNKPTFAQVLTLGPQTIREVPPLFVIPGLFNHSNVVEMCRTLLHPTFVALLPIMKSPLTEMAKILAEEIRTIFPKGPYNIIGISWGGALSIEIAKILQNHSNTQVTFIDGAPDTIQTTVANLGTNVDVEVNILSRLLGITSAEVLKTLNTSPDWKTRLDVALDNYRGEKNDIPALKTALDVLIHRLDTVTQYKQSEENVKGGVFLLRPTGTSKYDNCGLMKFTTQPTQIHVVTGDHISMLHNKELTHIINEHVATR